MFRKISAPVFIKEPQPSPQKNAAPTTIAVSITVNNKLLTDGGISEPWKQTRLKWLNSTLAQDNTVIAPYTPLQVQGNTINLLGRKIALGNDGLPQQIQTFFTEEMTDFKTAPNNILTAPFRIVAINKADGKELQWNNSGLQFTMQTPGTVQWIANNGNDALQMNINASLEFDGFLFIR